MAFVLILVLAALAFFVLAGPRPAPLRLDPTLPSLPEGAGGAAAWLAQKEAGFTLKPDNQARILWAGAQGEAAATCLVYLHGFSASWREGAPVSVDTARRYGANLLQTRLRCHGLQDLEPLLNMKAVELWDDAKESLVLGHALGRHVVLMATSSGAPLALALAALHPDLVRGLILYSPNIRIRGFATESLTWPWGLQLARLAKGGLYNDWEGQGDTNRYWYNRQRLEGAVQLQVLLEAACPPELLAKVTCPVYAAAYYKDETHQDPTVDVAAIRRMMGRLGTPTALRRYQEFPEAGSHVIACDLLSRDWEGVEKGTWGFLERVMNFRPKPGESPLENEGEGNP